MQKTPEDEAFDDLAKRQGAWGGGFPAKRQSAIDKINAAFDEEYIKYRVAFPKEYTAASVLGDQVKYGASWSKDGERIDPMSVYNEPAQEPARGAFERFVCNKWDSLGTGIVGRKADGKYIATHVETMWETWQAALAQPAQEPAFGWIKQSELAQARLYGGSVNLWLEKHDCDFPVYVSPPQRPWVGLTDEQIEEMANDFEEGYVFLYRSYARAIEQYLKEKNT